MKRVLLTLAVCIVLALFAGAYLLMMVLPSGPEIPEAPVLAVPAEIHPGPMPPYAGPHPRNWIRPVETFPFPILPGQTGPAESLYAGANQYPFHCGRDNSRDWVEDAHVQPQVDNQDGIGIPVFAVADGKRDTDTIVGYSKDCLFPTHVRYYYKRVGEEGMFPLEEADNDIERIEVNGRSVDFIVRLETGTINRFFYAIAALRTEGETETSPSPQNWNKRLVYQLNGGVGIGRSQGDFSINDLLEDRYAQLRDGYAVIYSTANETGNHYNIWLAEDTAYRVKRQFMALYGEPMYTVGIGGSGGAIQQYLFAQNSPGLLDAAIPLYSYPDMITQTIHVMDCELLEQYFDVTDASNPDWKVWENRSWIQGLAANSEADNRFAPLAVGVEALNGKFTGMRERLRGSSECINGWRGLTPLIYNPRFAMITADFAPEVAAAVNWNHWDDLRDVYGVDERGYSYTTWDNVGVQYGLDAVRQGQISIEQFLDLNARIGSWKPVHDMQEEQFWFLTGQLYPPRLSLRSEQNMQLTPEPGQRAAPRHEGNLQAMQAAYRSGHVFIGLADIPILDLRHYLDPELDMHHSSASFSARARMIRSQGHADNQVIWMTRRPDDPQVKAFELMDRWMLNLLNDPKHDVVAARPGDAVDACFSEDGSLLASGDGVWDGDWNNASPGECMQHYPAYRTSREVAGGGPEADVFKCRRRSIDEAMASGVYEGIDIAAYRTDLMEIFPAGVCDYRLGDAAWPDDLLEPQRE